MPKVPGFYSPFDAMTFDNDHCFLCGSPLSQDGTAEHVFPKWLLEKYDLWDRKLTLLNGTTIAYRQLTVPCCQKCNNKYLSSLEMDMRDAVNAGLRGYGNLTS